MNVDEFDEEMKRLTQAYGRYGESVQQRIWFYCSAISGLEFKRIVDSFLDGDKKPGVQDFRAKMRGFFNHKREYDKEKREYVPAKRCSKCWDCGIVIVKTNDGEDYAMSCPCLLNDYWKLPVYSDSLGFSLYPPETGLKWMIPENKKEGVEDLKTFGGKVEKFKKIMKMSEKHWGL